MLEILSLDDHVLFYKCTKNASNRFYLFILPLYIQNTYERPVGFPLIDTEVHLLSPMSIILCILRENDTKR